MQIKEILQKAKKLLKNAAIPSYAIDAELLLAETLDITREQIICFPERIISDEENIIFEKLVTRRLSREPMSHILGRREFWGMEFKVTKDTLDPRPDSETLIECALELFPDKENELKIIDFGTGTGCLLLTLLSEFPNATGVGIDISTAALKVAMENSDKLGLAKRSRFVIDNWGKEVKGQYDLIISNPPYIKSSSIKALDPEVAGYEPKVALDGGSSGLECYKNLAPFITSLMSEDGFAILEIGIRQDEDVKSILEGVNLKFVTYRKDLAGINRCIVVCA